MYGTHKINKLFFKNMLTSLKMLNESRIIQDKFCLHEKDSDQFREKWEWVAMHFFHSYR